MNIPIRFKTITLCFLFPMTVIAQTFSPYTPKQIQEFNNQPIAPAETPASPFYLEPPPVRQKQNASIDSRYIKNPDSEEQAEAQGAESTVPFEPNPSTFTF
jgi:hypothetical protein